MASPLSGDPSPAGLPPPPVATPGESHGPAAPPEPPFPDIYGGDAQLWAAHFRGIGRAYRALGKEDDFAIRVLTEDFTLPFPFAWPPGPDPARGPLFYDPHDRTGFDFLLRGPGAPPPALLRPLHATAQAAVRKRRLERLALSYAARARPGPACCCWRPGPAPAPAPSSRGPRGPRPPPLAAPPGWASPLPTRPIKSCSSLPAQALCWTPADRRLVVATPLGRDKG
ncbi:LOW QUALITY PROTEIN: actin cytoskeleton-regulatory complex protein PAN1 [Ursus americanus]|uniref:LOW QUALITY PROTEIN: actin cytoskeleton-regulatory complex protein PAN1 n=1 Tax=Ursus americanus TaxID=9643 RepID=UPI001E67CDD4|nr:LOW QUALITY PROTEIN: actin cytoskeleton-regulatory complex protein PAN1 [Ursus americanus]